MVFSQTPLSGSYLINVEPKVDERGFFSRYFCEEIFRSYGLNTRWVQINNSYNKFARTLRGLHFQYPPHSEVKMIRCIKGAIWDVIVDLRRGSDTYSSWYASELNENNRTMMYVPTGFAHGFISLTDNTEIIYMVSSAYSADAEGIIRWDDTFHGINWPLNPLIISEKDKNAKDWNHNKSIQL